MYQELIEENPKRGWGWIYWSDCYHLHAGPHKDLARAEQILNQALEVEGVSDRQDILERLAAIHEATGRRADARKIRSKP